MELASGPADLFTGMDPNVEHDYEDYSDGDEEAYANMLDAMNQGDADCVPWIRDRLSLLSEYKSSYFTDQHFHAIQTFLNSPANALFGYLNKDPPILHIVTEIPTQSPDEIVYFVKLPGEKVKTENIERTVHIGKVRGNAMDSLLQLMNAVYLPMFLDNKSWPKSVKKELTRQLHKFMANLTETASQQRGTTELYIPAEHLEDTTQSIEAAAEDRDLVQRLESTIIHWTRQVKEVLQAQDNSSEFGESSGPLAEIEFWRSRAKDLGQIQKQLESKEVKCILQVLDQVHSHYLEPFLPLSTRIEEESRRSLENEKYLNFLRGPCEQLAKSKPKDIPAILPAVLNCVRLVWSISSYYHTPDLLSGLLRKVSNEIINRCNAEISLEDIFDGDVGSAIEALKASRECGQAWMDLYQKTTDRLQRMNRDQVGDRVWDFDSNSIFAPVKYFVQRCENLHEVCEGQIQFARRGGGGGERLPMPAFGGTKGSEITASLVGIEDRFDALISNLRSGDYDKKAVGEGRWQEDFTRFKDGVKDLELMYQNVITTAFNSVSTVQGKMEVLEVFRALAKRESISSAVAKCEEGVWLVFLENVRTVTREFENSRRNPTIPSNHPKYAGAAMWAVTFLTRINREWQLLKNASFLSHSDRAADAESQYDILVASLEDFISKTRTQFSSWVNQEGDWQAKLDIPVMKRVDDELMVNFDPMVLKLLNEVRYWERLRKEIPQQALELHNHNKTVKENLRVLRQNVVMVVRFYNSIIDAIKPDQRDLFRERIKFLDKKILLGTTTKKWSGGADILLFVRECLHQASECSEVVNTFNGNLDSMNKCCRRIAEKDLVKVQKTIKYEMNEFRSKQRAYQRKVCEELERTHHEMLEVLATMYETFRYDSDDVQEQWTHFVETVDEMTLDALKESVDHSLNSLHLAVNGDSKSTVAAVFRIYGDLGADNRVFFKPSLDELVEMVDCVEIELFNCVKVVPRMSEVLPPVLDAAAEDEDEEERRKRKKQERARARRERGDDPEAPAVLKDSFFELIREEKAYHATMLGIKNGMKLVNPKLISIQSEWRKNYEVILDKNLEPFMDRFIAKWQETPKIALFDAHIIVFQETDQQVANEDEQKHLDYVQVDMRNLKTSSRVLCKIWQDKFTSLLNEIALRDLDYLWTTFTDNTKELGRTPGDLKALDARIKLLEDLHERMPEIEESFAPLNEKYDMLQRWDVRVPANETQRRDQLPDMLVAFRETLSKSDIDLKKSKDFFKAKLLGESGELQAKAKAMWEDLQARGRDGPRSADTTAEKANQIITAFQERANLLHQEEKEITEGLAMFNVEQTACKDLATALHELELMEAVWLLSSEWNKAWAQWKARKFMTVNVKTMEEEALKFLKRVQRLGRDIKEWSVWVALKDRIDQFKHMMPLVGYLKDDALRDRHWEHLLDEMERTLDRTAEDFTLEKIFVLGFDQYAEIIAQICEDARHELAIEESLRKIEEAWADLQLTISPYKATYNMLTATDDIFLRLEEDMVTMSHTKASRYYHAFQPQIEGWESLLSHILETVELMLKVQKAWMYLENIFMGPGDIKKQLASESATFAIVNTQWNHVMKQIAKEPKAKTATAIDDLGNKLASMYAQLEEIQKYLNDYLEKKRQEFPRFYFLSNDELLEILGQSRNPEAVQPHLKKCFEGINALDFSDPNEEKKKGHSAVAMLSVEGERVGFVKPILATGAVETWLRGVQEGMKGALTKELRSLQGLLRTKSRGNLLNNLSRYPGQLWITASQIMWTSGCEKAMHDIQNGEKRSAMKDLLRRQKRLIASLTSRVKDAEMSPLDRKKLVALLTIEVHQRDVIETLVRRNVTAPEEFDWQQQLRFYWDHQVDSCIIQQTISEFNYGYEYLGCSGRLVITPLTDRCYITLTTALHLNRGGNPQGPAGTGKTETVKDLGKGIAKYVMVFNCGEGLDFQSMERMFSGLAQTGSWSCLDEFNRIETTVLSVIAQQISSILTAVMNRQERFVFETKEIRLDLGVGIFVTMNPGYAGRSELPDNLKSLFRPVSMMVPNSAMIAEIMLFAEGFTEAKVLSKKITTLYSLGKQQLSKQDHYDWGLRAIKSVLVAAGNKKRKYPDAPENLTLMTAMRDMNLSKFVADDVPLFLAILSDLFQGLDLPEAEDDHLSKAVDATMEAMGLEAAEFIKSKVIQLHDVLRTRHGVMLVGETGSGKTTCWTVLQKSLSLLRQQGIAGFSKVNSWLLNPKAVDSPNELYGQYNASYEWSYGILSTIIKTVCEEGPEARWVVMDGPVDTLWIESMNTVLDDNKMLTLNNGVRITLPDEVRLLFEVPNLKVASPATVSRTGMVYLDVTKLGWRPYVKAWLRRRADPEGNETLLKLFEKYVDRLLEFKKTSCVELTPIDDLNAVTSLCNLYDALATLENGVTPTDVDFYHRMIELWFLFCLVWSIGAGVDEDSRKQFDMYLREIDGQFPSRDTVYEHCVDWQNKAWAHWEDQIPSGWSFKPETPFYKVLVPTVDTVRNSFLVTNLIKARKHILLVGGTGTGKTSTVEGVLANINRLGVGGKDAENPYAFLNINFSAKTSARAVQNTIETRYEKRTKEMYYPQLGKKLICFIDELSMPEKEEFGAQPPLEFLRQWIDNGFWFDKSTQSTKKFRDMLLVAAMGPPGGGRSPISPRVQSRFNCINITFPSDMSLRRIFSTLITQHLLEFEQDIKPLGDTMVQATIDLYNNVASSFLPTPSKRHYLFNLRDISRVFQGLLRSNKTYYENRESVAKLWVHECFRVFADRLADQADRRAFRSMMVERVQNAFQMQWSKLIGKSEDDVCIFGDFMREDVEDPVYEDVGDYPKLNKLRTFMKSRLEAHNDEIGVVKLDLVLFNDALEHVCRIHRIIRQPRGNALLVGVGGSGRSSLAKLAAFVAEQYFFQIEMSKNYGTSEFREDMKRLYLKALERPVMFLFSDTQIVDESFLEDINNILSVGEVPSLFASDDLNAIYEDLQQDAQRDKILPEQMYNYFIDRARDNIHIVLTFSPGASFRDRLRQYPALVANMNIDWFFEWPRDALKQVAQHFLEDMDLGTKEVKKNIVELFVYAHEETKKTSALMLAESRRRNNITPTNYLELVRGYCDLLDSKRMYLTKKKSKLQAGLDKLDETSVVVQEMSVELEENKKLVEVMQKECQEFLTLIVSRKQEAHEQARQVAADQERISIAEVDVKKMQAEAKIELDRSMPTLHAAEEALKVLTKTQLAELRSMNNPPLQVRIVLEAVMVLLGVSNAKDWGEVKKQLNQAGFVQSLLQYPRDQMSDSVLKKVAKYCQSEEFTPVRMKQHSVAASYLCGWVRAMENYGYVHRDVQPKIDEVEKLTSQLESKQEELRSSKEKLALLTENMEKLKAEYNEKFNENTRLRKEAEDTETRLNRAETLVAGLAGSRERWELSIQSFEEEMSYLPGDCMLAAAFLSYAGPFSSDFRTLLMKDKWDTRLHDMKIPRTPDFDTTKFLAKATDVRDWNVMGLPNDNFSTENGVLVTRGRRWALMIDPQAQANKWVKRMERGAGLKVIDQKSSYLPILEHSIKYGNPVLLEDVLEDIDAALDPVLNKAIVTKGNSRYIRLGDKLIDYHEDFRFYISTKLNNPNYAPEVSAKTTMVNFSVKAKGLEDQLLGTVVALEKPSLEEQKEKMVREMAEDRRTLDQLEDDILDLLNNAQGTLLEDEKLTDKLQHSKTTSEDIKAKLEAAEINEKKIDAARETYRECAKRASILFFVLLDIATIDPMYQFSLDGYVSLFSKSIDNSRVHTEDIAERIKMLNEYHTFAVYSNTCRGLFAKHKLLFSFHMCVKILMGDDKLNVEEYVFLLRGGVVLDREVQARNPANWLSEEAWDNITELDKLSTFQGIANSFEQMQTEWRKWYEGAEPEEAPLPGEWNKLNELQFMIVVRCLRKDRIFSLMSAFVANSMDAKYVEPPSLNLSRTFADSDASTPLIFVLSPGIDPKLQLQALAEAKDRKFRSLALGRGQSSIAHNTIVTGMREGWWVFLANCHLMIEWMPNLEKIVVGLAEADDLHPDFRLWLSSKPHPDFPIAILQTSIKLTTEPPRGLKANLKRLFGSLISSDMLENSSKPHKYKKLLFTLAWFHSLLLERRKFLTLGLNIPYDFNDSDFEVSTSLLSIYVDMYAEDSLPWNAITFFISDINYGGRVTDDWDRRLLATYSKELFVPEALEEPMRRLSELAVYYLPDDGTHESYQRYIDTLPKDDKPQAFGQHPNADTSSQIQESATLLATLVAMQPQVAVGVGQSKEEAVLDLAGTLLYKLPRTIELEESEKIRNKALANGEAVSPLLIVLFQEAQRYNELLAVIRKSLEDLINGIKGLVVMSAELDDAFDCLVKSRVPPAWLYLYPSAKSLASWVRDLALRCDQLQSWALGAVPKVFWLAGFTFPTGFLTALLQLASRKNSVSIDNLTWEFTVLNVAESEITTPPKDGAYIKGLILEGASWDTSRGVLDEPNPMELLVTMPIVHFKPVEIKSGKTKAKGGSYQCPCYYYPWRAGTSTSPSYVITVDLKTAVASEHWIKRGTALLLSDSQ